MTQLSKEPLSFETWKRFVSVPWKSIMHRCRMFTLPRGKSRSTTHSGELCLVAWCGLSNENWKWLIDYSYTSAMYVLDLYNNSIFTHRCSGRWHQFGCSSLQLRQPRVDAMLRIAISVKHVLAIVPLCVCFCAKNRIVGPLVWFYR